MTQTLWTGTVDNLELSGMPNGDRQPMRVVDAEGRLMTEFAFSRDNNGAIEYDENNWIADTGMRFRDMDPTPDTALLVRMVAANLIGQ